MPLILPTDNAMFMDAVDGFAEPIVLFPGLSNERTISGIYSNQVQTYDEITNMTYSTNDPSVFCATADVSDVVPGTTQLIADSTTYRVKNINSDGTGFSELLLWKVT